MNRVKRTLREVIAVVDVWSNQLEEAIKEAGIDWDERVLDTDWVGL
jgi:hypothetical protein